MRNLVLLLALALTSVSAHAIPMVQLDGNIATGILDLDLNGTIYNVSFVENSFDVLNVGSNHALLGDESGANNAVDEIVALLTMTITERTFSEEWAHFLVPYEILNEGLNNEAAIGNNVCVRCAAGGPGPWVNQGHGSTNNDGARTVYAIFSEIGTPLTEPGTLGLLGFGLVGGVWIRRTRGTKKVSRS